MKTSAAKLFLAAVLMMACASVAFAAEYKYVDSPEGLRIRDSSSLSGKRIGGLVHNQKVEVVAVGEDAVIDGIKAPWIKIRVPEAQTDVFTDVYGWVFGGYLTDKVPEPEKKYLGAVNGNGSGKGIFDVKKKIESAIPVTAPENLPQIVRKDFSGDYSKMISAVDFGSRLYVKNGDDMMQYFTELPPYTAFGVTSTAEPGYYQVSYYSVTCYARKDDVVSGAVPGFTLKDTDLYASAGGGAAAASLKPRTFLLVTGESQGSYVKVKVQDGKDLKDYYVRQADIWWNQNDVLALQALRSEEDVLAFSDNEQKVSGLMVMLEATAGYSETNLFQKDHLRLAKLWDKYDRARTSTPADTLTASEMYASVKALETRFSTSAAYGYLDPAVTCIGNYIADIDSNRYVPAVFMSYPISSWNTTVIAYFYDSESGGILPVRRYSIEGEKNLPRRLKALYKASLEKTKEGTDSYLEYFVDSWSDSDIAETILGTDYSDSIKDWNVSIWGTDIREDAPEKMVVRTGLGKAKIYPIPGTRFGSTGTINEGTEVVPSKYTVIWIKGWGESTPSMNYIYVTGGGKEGWVAASSLRDPAADDSSYYGSGSDSLYSCYNYTSRSNKDVIVQSLNGTSAWLYEDMEDNNSPLTLVASGTKLKATMEYVYSFSDGWESVGSRSDYLVTAPDGTQGWLRNEDVYESVPRYDYWRLK